MSKEDVFKLNKNQEKAIKSLQKALDNIEKSGLFIVSEINNMSFYKKDMVDKYTDDISINDNTKNVITKMEALKYIYSIINFKADILADDDHYHRLILTNKGWKKWNNN